ncbi:MAG: adenine deaminase, partial [Limosilactobacillus mucosae]|nr:adenine deaminase [Limosilactobacillus mucosae]
VLTDEAIRQVSHDETGDFVYDPSQDVVKLAVIERHHATGKMCTALVSGYGIKHGAIAISIGHDSHNIMTAGVSDSEMLAAVAELIKQGGGVVMVKDQKPIARMALPIAGLMSDQPAEQVVAAQNQINQTAHQELGIPENIDPVMSLSFLPLAVIPKLKLTDEGLFDVANGRFVTLEVDDQA